MAFGTSIDPAAAAKPAATSKTGVAAKAAATHELAKSEEEAQAADATSRAAKAAADFESFLKLLTTQLRNQDPLQPLESTEFVAQLASFAAVEQQIGTNTRLDQLVQSLSGNALDRAASYLDRSVEVAGGKVAFDGETPVAVTYDPGATAVAAAAEVRDAKGTTVATFAVPATAGTQTAEWDGLIDGKPAEPGIYEIAVRAARPEGEVETVATRTVSRVSAVSLEGGEPRLRLDTGAEVALGDTLSLS